jgi:hypothetical protein
VDRGPGPPSVSATLDVRPYEPAGSVVVPSVRPQVNPALRRIWRDGSTVQFGSDPETAVVITGLDEARVRLIERFDGTADLAMLRRAAVRMGLEATVVSDVVRLLDASGVLQDAGAKGAGAAPLDPAERDRLAPDAAASSLLARTAGARSGLARRRTAVVTVHGAGRVGASVASLLASAGVGTVVTQDAGMTRPADLAPAGLRDTDLGSRRQDAMARHVHRLAPSTRTTPRTSTAAPDLAIIATDTGWSDTAQSDRLLRAGLPHLLASVRENTGVVGPFVLPGRTSCHRCHELHRTDRDPAWPSVSAQLAAPGPGVAPCDVVLATSVAASASLMALAFLEQDRRGWPLPLAADGTVEIAQATGRVRRRSWTRHPACGCGWLPEALGL